MLSGASTSMVGSSGRRSQAIAISASATIASAAHFAAQRQQHLNPGREQQPGGGGGQTGEHMLHVGIVLEAGVDHTQPHHDRRRRADQAQQGAQRTA